MVEGWNLPIFKKLCPQCPCCVAVYHYPVEATPLYLKEMFTNCAILNSWFHWVSWYLCKMTLYVGVFVYITACLIYTVAMWGAQRSGDSTPYTCVRFTGNLYMYILILSIRPAESTGKFEKFVNSTIDFYNINIDMAGTIYIYFIHVYFETLNFLLF